jgi:hypothetical protein
MRRKFDAIVLNQIAKTDYMVKIKPLLFTPMVYIISPKYVLGLFLYKIVMKLTDWISFIYSSSGAVIQQISSFFFVATPWVLRNYSNL